MPSEPPNLGRQDTFLVLRSLLSGGGKSTQFLILARGALESRPPVGASLLFPLPHYPRTDQLNRRR